jgi:protoporphyrinogen oxidase
MRTRCPRRAASASRAPSRIAMDERVMPDQPIAILGGGLAGLAASFACGAPVYEAQGRAGGVAASDTVDGFTFDRGIHVLQTKNERILKLLVDLGVRLNERQRKAYIYSHRTYTAYPFQVNTSGLPVRLRARCVLDFLMRDRRAEPRNYEEWMYANLGRGFAETFLIPYSEKFWTVHPREMTHEWTGSRVPQPPALQVVRGALWDQQVAIGSNAVFRYPNSEPGYGAIAQALARSCGALHLSHRATRIDLERRSVHFANGASVRYGKLISTIPLPDLIGICSHAPPDVQEAAGRLRTNGILVVNVAIAEPGRNDWHWAHFPGKDVSFFRLSFPHNFAGNLTPPGMSSISAEVAYSPERGVDRERTVRTVLDDLARVGLLRPGSVAFTTTTDIARAYCIYDAHRKGAVRRLRQWLANWDILPAGRYGLWSYFWSDEAMMSGMQTAERATRSATDRQFAEATSDAE